jgi:hypothetical protein
MPWEEIKVFQHTHDVTKEGCYECHEIEHTAGMPRAAELDIGKTYLSILRDSYSQSVRRNKFDSWCPWQWQFDEEEVWVNPKAADTMSQMWNDIWRTALEICQESYPITESYVNEFIRDAKEILDYAAVHGLWIRIVHNNGY